MNHWKLTLSYDGGPFHGWQVQPDLPTVQGELAEAIRQVTGEAVLPQGSGRTDAGVHALGQVASLALAYPIPAGNFLRALNRVLPASIRLLAATPVDEGFHARHSAQGKTYEYRIFERRVAVSGSDAHLVERPCSPFLAPYVWDCRWPIMLERMQEGAAHFPGTHDFTSFAASDPERGVREEDDEDSGMDRFVCENNAQGEPTSVKGPASAGPKADSNERGFSPGGSTANLSPAPAKRTGVNPVKTIHSATWERREDMLIFTVRGSGFLHHMVRNMVGTLVDVGRGSLLASAIPAIIAARDRTASGPTAPGRGLFLREVEYDPRYADAAPEVHA